MQSSAFPLEPLLRYFYRDHALATLENLVSTEAHLACSFHAIRLISSRQTDGRCMKSREPLRQAMQKTRAKNARRFNFSNLECQKQS